MVKVAVLKVGKGERRGKVRGQGQGCQKKGLGIIMNEEFVLPYVIHAMMNNKILSTKLA